SMVMHVCGQLAELAVPDHARRFLGGAARDETHWKDFTPFAVRSGALFMLWCGGDFGRGVVLQGSQL
ncbi:hypothetical protein RBA01_14015, partial [Mycobacteroides abscessus subsp. massiliense]